jgi:peptidoglycan/xylan/chitin deacetylase (PgdA/CDA1 family)
MISPTVKPLTSIKEIAESKDMHARPDTQTGIEVPVLMYHSIAIGSTPKFRNFVVHPDDFAAQMDYLAARDYRAVTAAEMAFGLSSGLFPMTPRPIVLTFDDAYIDFYTTALPLLQRYGFAATLYVPTAYVGGTARWLETCGEQNRRLLSWQALRDIAAERIEVASHSHSHAQMDRVPKTVVIEEVHRSKCLIEDNLGLAVNGFAYPFGYWNRAVQAAVASAGYDYACTVGELTTTSADGTFTLPRLTVNAESGTDGLAKLLAIRATRSRRNFAAAKRIAWRALRAGTNAGGWDL